MTVCKSEEAGNYKCCTMDKPCDGNNCMAWVRKLKDDPNAPVQRGFRNLPMPPIQIDSGFGYCGLVAK